MATIDIGNKHLHQPHASSSSSVPPPLLPLLVEHVSVPKLALLSLQYGAPNPSIALLSVPLARDKQYKGKVTLVPEGVT